jgi:hypothetical protein
MRVGSGSSIRIWRDNWIPRPPSLKIGGSLWSCRLRKVCLMIDQRSNSWDESTLRRYFYPWDVDEILKIKLPANASVDRIAWHYEKSGVFSIRSAYRVAMNLEYNVDGMGSSSAPMGERAIWRRLWNSHVLPKVRMFIWKLIRNGIPTNANRHYRHMLVVSSCEMCGHCYEVCFHATIRCFHAAALRRAMSKWW